MAGKIAGCGAGAMAFNYNVREAGIIGLGMNGRGAVELVMASVVIRLSDKMLAANEITSPLLTQVQFSGLVIMALVTTILAPLSLKWAITRTCLPVEKSNFCTLWDEKGEVDD